MLNELVRQSVQRCIAAGVPREAGAVLAWVMQHCTYEPGDEFYVTDLILAAWLERVEPVPQQGWVRHDTPSNSGEVY